MTWDVVALALDGAYNRLEIARDTLDPDLEVVRILGEIMAEVDGVRAFVRGVIEATPS